MLIINKSGMTIGYEVWSSSTTLFKGQIDNLTEQYFDLTTYAFPHNLDINIYNSPQVGNLAGIRLITITPANKDAIFTFGYLNPDSQ